MHKIKLPSMGALLAFEAAARHESFTRASMELFLTESAVSRQIAILEDNLGVRLFVRSKQRVVLTRAGRLYSLQVRDALESLDRDTISIMAHGGGGGFLELAVLPTFATEWLIPRMKHFNKQFDEVRVNMGVRTDTFSFPDSHFEAAIHYGKPTWSGTSADYLFGEDIVPVCARTLLGESILGPEDLIKYPLLHSTTRPNEWRRWFSHFGVDDNAAMHGTRYESHSMLIAAASAGLGIALVPRFFISGRPHLFDIIIPVDRMFAKEEAYYLVYPTELSHGKPLQVFRDWLLGEAKVYRSDEQEPR